jgi:hypothetical protein
MLKILDYETRWIESEKRYASYAIYIDLTQSSTVYGSTVKEAEDRLTWMLIGDDY